MSRVNRIVFLLFSDTAHKYAFRGTIEGLQCARMKNVYRSITEQKRHSRSKICKNRKTSKCRLNLLQKYNALFGDWMNMTYKDATMGTEERENNRRRYLEMAGIHKDWISEKEI